MAMRLITCIRGFLPIVVGLVGFSCTGTGNPYSSGPNGSGGGIPPSTDPSEARTPVPLSGPSIGSKTAPDYDLRKTAPVYVRKSHDALRVATNAYLVRASTNQSVPYLTIAVENISSDSITGFTKLMGVSVIADGVEVLRKESLSARGKVGVSAATSQYSWTCVWPGMTAYCLSILSNADFESNFQVEIDSVVSSPSSFRDPYEQVYANSYNLFDDTLEIRAENVGSYSAEVEESWLYVLLDYRNEPVLWGFTDSWDTGILNPRFSTYRNESVYFEGEADRIFVPVHYGPVYSESLRKGLRVGEYASAAPAEVPVDSDAGRLYRLESREAAAERLHYAALQRR